MKKLLRTHIEPIYGMSVVDKDEFDLPYDIWLDPAGKSRNVKHSLPQVKVVVDGQRIPFSIEDNPKPLINKHIKDEQRICEWIAKNKENLLKQWNRELTDSQVLKLLEK